jgi:predicted membrane channel-forming protein YqfA (hemolysin III family)
VGRSLARATISGLLILEAAQSALWIARLLPSLGVRDRTTVALVCLRAAISGMQMVSGVLLRIGRLSAPAVARSALLASASLMPFEMGWRLVPTNLDPTYRWWITAGYAMYAAGAIWYLNRDPPGLKTRGSI